MYEKPGQTLRERTLAKRDGTGEHQRASFCFAVGSPCPDADGETQNSYEHAGMTLKTQGLGDAQRWGKDWVWRAEWCLQEGY